MGALRKKSACTSWPSTQRAEPVGSATGLNNPTAVRNSQQHLHRGFSRCTTKTRWIVLKRKAWQTFKPCHLCKTASSALCMAGFLLYRSVGIIKLCQIQWGHCSQQEMPDFIFEKDERPGLKWWNKQKVFSQQEMSCIHRLCINTVTHCHRQYTLTGYFQTLD